MARARHRAANAASPRRGTRGDFLDALAIARRDNPEA